jgi:hypothetical protein
MAEANLIADVDELVRAQKPATVYAEAIRLRGSSLTPFGAACLGAVPAFLVAMLFAPGAVRGVCFFIASVFAAMALLSWRPDRLPPFDDALDAEGNLLRAAAPALLPRSAGEGLHPGGSSQKLGRQPGLARRLAVLLEGRPDYFGRLDAGRIPFAGVAVGAFCAVSTMVIAGAWA